MNIILMGVSGTGKSTLGDALSNRLGWPFFDADGFHPPENIAKMATGQALNDADRKLWLENIAASLRAGTASKTSQIISCSALKKIYRQQLRSADPDLRLIYLHGDFELIYRRMMARPAHFFKADLLQSQFDTLEPPQSGLHLDVGMPVDALCEQIIAYLNLQADE